MKADALTAEEQTLADGLAEEAHAETEHQDASGEVNLRRMLPRISIDAFVTNADVIQTVEKAVRDRRASRVEAQVLTGGFKQAIARYAEQPPADIIVIESVEPAELLSAQIDALADLCPPSSRLLLIGSENSVELYRKLLRLGVSDYLIRPVQPLSLIEALAGMLGEDDNEILGQVLAFVGVRGGTGASTVAQNVAHGLAHKFNATTILIDADIGFGTASLQFDISPARTLDDAVKEGDALDKEVLERLVHWRDRRFGIIAAPARPDEAMLPGREQVRRIVEQARRVARYVVLDVPREWGPVATEVLTLADTVTLVATPDLVALRNTRTLIQMIKVLRPNDPAPAIILNQKPLRGKPAVTAEEFSATLNCPLMAQFPSDPETLAAAQMAGKILLEHAPKSQVASQILDLTSKLALHSVPRASEKPARTGVLAKLFRRKGSGNE